MQNQNGLARTAGGLYLALIVTGIIGMVYIPAQLIVFDDPAATVRRLSESLLLFKWGIVSTLICYTCFLLLPFPLYRLLQHAGRTLAMVMLALVVVGAAVQYANVVNWINTASLLSDPTAAGGLSAEQRQMQIMLWLRAFNTGATLNHAVASLWLIPFGLLLLKTRLLPRLLGVLVLLAAAGYLADFFMKFVLGASGIPLYIALPGTVGEFGTCLWLLLLGARTPRLPEPVPGHFSPNSTRALP